MPGDLDCPVAVNLGSIPPHLVGLPVWYNDVLVTSHGTIRALSFNAYIALTQDPAVGGKIRRDGFRDEVMVWGPLPWSPHYSGPRPWQASDLTQATWWLQTQGIMVRSKVVHEVVEEISREKAYHPVIDYFRDLGWASTSIWDQRPRLGGTHNVGWLTTYCGAEDSPYIRAVGAAWAILAIARVFEPGSKASGLLALRGGDVAKKEVFPILGEEFYSNDITLKTSGQHKSS
jgi:Virulence-associated protein E